jgi:CRP-like cAMP-binding protein
MKRTAPPDFDPEAFLAKVGKGRTLGHYTKNQKVFSQGEPADAVFYIQSGRVKLTVVSKQGKEAVVAILGAGDFFGEGCLAGQPRRMASASAMSTCSVMRLEKFGGGSCAQE